MKYQEFKTEFGVFVKTTALWRKQTVAGQVTITTMQLLQITENSLKHVVKNNQDLKVCRKNVA